ncbi:MAG: hypothetical protein PHD48_12260 [Alphaproteobacteria bacterium]|nr:hypothetical protein [Alphaproteobacteria bacterium]
MIGILCGLKSEAKIADRIPGVLVGCSASKPDLARALVQQMIDQGVTRLISFGLCGGLSSDLVAGDLLLGMTVMVARGAWESDDLWNKKFRDKLPGTLSVPIWGSDHMATTVEDKALIFRRTGCLAVDMESHIVARAADNCGISFNVVRAVSDSFDTSLPAAACVPLLADGGIDYRAVYDSVKKDPRQIPELIRLGFSTQRAMRSLRRAVDVMRDIAREA